MHEKYQWKNRVVSCSTNLYDQQKINLQKRKELVSELKLIVVEDKSLKDQCHLIGLDGGVKEKSNKAFTLEFLKNAINSMPMRIKEISTNSN